jgi:hypothetical protein
MKALSLIQPWATLIAIGAKRIETRSWPTDYRGPLAIHASKWLGTDGRVVSAHVADCLSCCHEEPYRTALTRSGIESVRDLPSGALVATVRLVGVLRTDSSLLRVDFEEREFGDYSPGRYAWLLADVRPLPTPIPFRGMPGLWEFPDAALTVQTSALPKET